MSDKYQIDNHKLMYHVDRVSDWLAGKLVYPIYMEISPSGACNHRCSFCGLDYMEYQSRFLRTDKTKEALTELGGLGLKSVMYSGEGEPLLHKDLGDIIQHTREAGIEVAITTNGVLLNQSLAEKILPDTEWIKISISGATPETYAQIHGTDKGDFNRVVRNLSYAARLRDENKYRCVLGMQLLLLPENLEEATKLAELARDIGMDYLVIKPYSQHPLSKTQKYKDITYTDYQYLAEELARYNSNRFNVIFRLGTMEKWDQQEHDYQGCMALPFWSYVDAGGNVWGCSVYMSDERFWYGNIYESSFADIWQGEKRRESLRWVEQELDVDQCRVNCRMDKVNRYLQGFKNPPPHVNFI
ncbi:MAG: radical SAM protein [Planctomycetes bacterium]|nr:radical SAM protein [Planctomycetota bacterium]